jgi:hypothetical protein
MATMRLPLLQRAQSGAANHVDRHPKGSQMGQSSRVMGCVLGSALLIGCNAGPTTTPAGAVEDAVRSYSSAYLRGDGQKAYDMLSARCKTILSFPP